MIYTTINKLGLRFFRATIMLLLLVGIGATALAEDKIYPDKPNPPRLVNDFAGLLKPHEEDRLEHKLVSFDRTTSTQVTVVTIKNLGGHEVGDYAIKLFNRWGIGRAGKNNGALLLISLDDRKTFIVTGKGLEGVLTDAKSSRILRNELKPAFKQGDYFGGIDKATDAIIAVTKGEYTADKEYSSRGKKFPKGLIVLIFIIIIIATRRKGGGGGRGGGYMSGGGFGDIATGMLIGNMLGGGRSSGWGGGGGGFGGGGFGGFGGGSSGGGGAGGSW